VGATTYGSTAQAERIIERVRQVHERVTGVAPDGRPYRATDPQLLAYVHATEVDSFLRAVSTLGSTPVTSTEADRYVAEMAVVGEKLGGIGLPRSRADLRSYFLSVRPELRATSQARDAIRFLLLPPAPMAVRPVYGLVIAAAVGLVPRCIRRALLLPRLPMTDRVLVRPATKALLGVMAWSLGPSPVETAARARASGHDRLHAI
jgi:uncharacterized protein (DUF2236 family)